MNHLLLFRLIITTAQLLLMATSQWMMVDQAPAVWLWVVCAGYLLVLIALSQFGPERLRSQWWLVVDLLIWAVFLAQLGGVSNPVIWCLLLPTVLSALSQTMRFTWVLTLLANLVYGWLWWLTADAAVMDHHGQMMADHITGMWLGFVVISVMLTWVTTALMMRIQDKNDALRALEKQQQSDEALLRMATLATSLAHELGTPLASIQLLVDEIKMEASTSGLHNDLNLIDSQVSRCKSVLTRMTRLADARTERTTDWCDALGFIERLLEAGLIGQMRCEIRQTPPGAVLIQVDDGLELAMNNVLNNSVAAGANLLLIDLLIQGDFLQIMLTDDGAGQDYQNPQGLGMGLKLSARIINSLGGQLSFRAGEHGAVTTLEVPFRHA